LAAVEGDLLDELLVIEVSDDLSGDGTM